MKILFTVIQFKSIALFRVFGLVFLNSFFCYFIVLFKIVDWVSRHCIQLLLCCSVDFSFRFIHFFFYCFRYDRIICFRSTNMNARMCKKRNSWTSNWNKQKFVHTLVYVLMLRSHCCSIYYAICISCVMCIRLFCSIYLYIKNNKKQKLIYSACKSLKMAFAMAIPIIFVVYFLSFRLNWLKINSIKCCMHQFDKKKCSLSRCNWNKKYLLLCIWSIQTRNIIISISNFKFVTYFVISDFDHSQFHPYDSSLTHYSI